MSKELTETTYPLLAGSKMPPGVEDLRVPEKSMGHRISYHPINYVDGKWVTDTTQKKVQSWNRRPVTYVVLTKDGGAILYNWGDANVLPWKDVLDKANQAFDRDLQVSSHEISLVRGGILIDRSRETGMWTGDRNRYSGDVAAIATAMMDRGLLAPNAGIWIGNTAARKGERIGTAGEVAGRTEIPNRITLYHGTSNIRAMIIMRDGLQPMSFDQRIWNKSPLDKVRPEHREDSVYLTASLPQAEYYAGKAVATDRKRFGPAAMAAAYRRKQNISQRLASSAGIDNDFIRGSRADLEATERVIAMGDSFDGKFEPVILRVTLGPNDYANLMADDDFLRIVDGSTPEEWHRSLGHFGQVAYRGTIPPDRIRVIARGADAARKSR